MNNRNNFIPINPEEIRKNTFSLIGTDWMLITAGKETAVNTMTASWGGFGIIWHKKMCMITVRPTRYTYEFLEQSDYFTLSFFDDTYKDTLTFCGTHSGRDTDKIRSAGLTPVKTNLGSIFFGEAQLAIECRKIYFQDLNPKNFLDPSIEECYPEKDYHRIYIGEIISCYKQKEIT